MGFFAIHPIYLFLFSKFTTPVHQTLWVSLCHSFHLSFFFFFFRYLSSAFVSFLHYAFFSVPFFSLLTKHFVTKIYVFSRIELCKCSCFFLKKMLILSMYLFLRLCLCLLLFFYLAYKHRLLKVVSNLFDLFTF